MDNRLHIIVRNSLPSKGYMAAQSGHAIAEYMIEHEPHQTGSWVNDFLICLQASDGEFNRLQKKLDLLNIPHSTFREPDLDNLDTAIAVLNHPELFKKFKLI